MKIKKFVGKNLQDAFGKMKEEFGENAIILNTRTVKRKMEPGNESVTLFEVTAALDEGTAAPVRIPARHAIRQYQEQETVSRRAVPVNEQWNRPATESPESQQQLLATLQKYTEIDSLKEEIAEIKNSMQQVAELIRQQKISHLPVPLKELLEVLIANEVEEKLARLIVQTFHNKLTEMDWKDYTKLSLAMQKVIAGLVPVAPEIARQKKKPYIVVLVGPTGVGKTTTIAKISANLKIFQGKKVGIITADTFRIAAVEQIQTIANIAGIPLEVVYEPAEMPQAIRSLRDRDVILIDTVGRSQRKDEQIRQLKSFIDAVNPHEVHLVLSLTSSLRNLQDVVERFSVLKPNRLLFTKMDEVVGVGNLLNICSKVKLPVSYITTGQMVPDDIVVPDWPMLTRLIMQGF